ncbi:MAG: hypothetical protein WCX61_02315 [Candidatus Peribacteraceae bacterium]|jgi:hypothetical protein
MSSTFSTSDGIYDEVCDALVITFEVNRDDIREDSSLKELGIKEENFGLGLASFAHRMQLALTLGDLKNVLGGISPCPGEQQENPEVPIQEILTIRVGQIVAVVREKLLRVQGHDGDPDEKW